ncbi:cysteine peptidase family C39 domain-containing protein, partial [Parabacteroides distasonis]
MDCGSTCLRMIAKYYGRAYSIQNLREKAFITREGVSMLGISEAAEAIGFRTQGVWITVEDKERDRKRNLGFFFRYISPYRREMAQLV